MISKPFRLRRWRVHKILKKGESKEIGLFIVKTLPNKSKFDRFALVLSRKFAKLATDRNKKRRQIYEAIRLINKETNQKNDNNFDIVLIPLKQILTCNYEKIHQNVIDILSFLHK